MLSIFPRRHYTYRVDVRGWSWIFLLVTACGARATPPQRFDPLARAEYTVVGTADGTAIVSGRFEGVSDELQLPLLPRATNLVVEGGYVALAPDRLRAPHCRTSCGFRYEVSLASTAAPASTGMWVTSSDLLLMPIDRRPLEAPVHLHGQVASGLNVGAGVSRVRFDKTHEGAPLAFGEFLATELAGGLRLVVLSPSSFRANAAIPPWVHEAFLGVSQLYGRRPATHTQVFIEPVPDDDEVGFGQALTLSGAAVTLRIGTNIAAESLRRDWTLVHELIHLGFPTVADAHYWMEGLATYLEPLVRVHLGWYTAREAWSEYYQNMLETTHAPPLEKNAGREATYWGGAALMLLCDVELRQRTGRSLRDILRQNLERGRTSSDELKARDLLKELDGPAGGNGVLSPIFARHAFGAEPLPLLSLFEKLGVGRDGTLRDDAPLSGIRRAIMGER